jgi:hypothetical protein
VGALHDEIYLLLLGVAKDFVCGLASEKVVLEPDVVYCGHCLNECFIFFVRDLIDGGDVTVSDMAGK